MLFLLYSFFLAYPDICNTASSSIIELSIGEVFNLTSPYYPLNYPNDADCVILIQSSNDTNITNVIFHIYILHQNLETRWDFLAVGSGAEVTERSKIKELTSDVHPKSVIVPGPVLWMRFRTDARTSKEGFFLQIQMSQNSTCNYWNSLSPISICSYIYKTSKRKTMDF